VAKKSVQKVADWKALKLAGQSIFFAGRFEKWGQLTLELLKAFVRVEGGTLAETLNSSVSLVVLKEVTGTSSHEKKATLLNSKGASIAVIDADQLRTMLVPTQDEVHAMIQAGPEGYKLLRQRVDASAFNQYSFRNGGQRPYTLTKASMRGQNIKDAPLWCMDLEEVDLTNATVQTASNESYEIGNTRRSKLDGATIHAPFPDLIECSCRGADLSNSWVGFLMDKSRCSSDFTKAKMVRFHFKKTDMTGSTFDKAELTDTEFDKTNATKVSFREACLKSITTEKANFSGADFTKADLSEAELLGANLRDCNFTKAKLRGARLMGAQFQGACLDGADFTGANVAQADFTGVDLSKAIGLVLNTKQFSIGPKLKELSDIAKKAATFATTIEVKTPQETLRLTAENRWKSPQASWSRKLWASTLSDWDQSTKSIADAIVAAVGQWPDATVCPHTIHARGTKTGLMNRKLTQLAMEAWCETYGAPCPTADELKQAEAAAESNKDTIRASILAELDQPDGVKMWNERSHLDLETIKSFPSVDLNGKKLDGIDFSSLEFEQGNFEKASLAGADCNYGSFKNSNFRKATLSFSGVLTNFSQCDFTSANLNKADLSSATLKEANFSKANLKQAVLKQAKLQGAHLVSAKLDDCDWSDTEFDELTQFPKDFSVPAAAKWKGKGLDPRMAEIAKAASAGPIDMTQFMTIMELSVEKERMKKALSMLKAERFRLFAEATDDHIVGVVKSQNDPDLVYSCRLGKDGDFACCTQNLNVCGGLRGALCKHLLVLIIGMTKAEELDPTTVNQWIATSRFKKPELNKETMSETLLRYKGAEAGEVDWRPTETIPEDYFAL
jgi:uncharacterized protein YjbI with pentapeptide repeats